MLGVRSSSAVVSTVQTRNTETELPATGACKQNGGATEDPVSAWPLGCLSSTCPDLTPGIPWKPRKLIQLRCHWQKGANFSHGEAWPSPWFILLRAGVLSTPTGLRSKTPWGGHVQRHDEHPESSIAA